MTARPYRVTCQRDYVIAETQRPARRQMVEAHETMPQAMDAFLRHQALDIWQSVSVGWTAPAPTGSRQMVLFGEVKQLAQEAGKHGARK